MLKSAIKQRNLTPRSKTPYSALLLSIILVFLAWAVPYGARADTDLQEAWQEIVKLQPPTYETLKQAGDRFIKTRQQSGSENASIYSLALLQMAENKHLSPEIKELLTTTAIKISPDYTFPETAFSKLMFAQHHYLKSLTSFFRALKKFKSNPLESLYASTFFWLSLAFVPLALLFFISLILSLKYYRAFCEMGDLKLGSQGSLVALFTSIAVAFLIIILPAPLLGLLILSATLALLATRRDVITLLLLVASLIIVPLAYEKGMASLLALDSSFFKAVRSSSSGIDNGDSEAALNRPAANQSQLVLQLFSQAEAARHRREFSKATIFLKKIIADNIEIGAVYNNLANLYILQGDYKKSEDLFKKAAELEKDSGIPYYNLSVTYIQENFDLQKSSQALAKAFKRDPGLSKIQSGSTNSESELRTGTKLFFMSLPENFYRRYADSQPGKKIYLPEFFRQALFPGANKIIYFILVITSLGGIIYLLRLTPANRRICSDCGRMFHPVQDLRKRRCPVCSMNNIAQSGSRLQALGGMTNDKARPLHILRLLAGVVIPGFYPLITGCTLIGISLMLPAILWLYNMIICQTAIVAPFPASSTWLNGILPLFIWSINFVVLILLPHWQYKFSGGKS